MAKERQKILPTPGFELQVSQCLFGATLSFSPEGLDILQSIYYYTALQSSTEGLTVTCAAACVHCMFLSKTTSNTVLQETYSQKKNLSNKNLELQEFVA